MFGACCRYCPKWCSRYCPFKTHGGTHNKFWTRSENFWFLRWRIMNTIKPIPHGMAVQVRLINCPPISLWTTHYYPHGQTQGHSNKTVLEMLESLGGKRHLWGSHGCLGLSSLIYQIPQLPGPLGGPSRGLYQTQRVPRMTLVRISPIHEGGL